MGRERKKEKKSDRRVSSGSIPIFDWGLKKPRRTSVGLPGLQIEI